MRELNVNEVEQVNGGIAPVIGLAAALAGHFTARSVGSYIISRVGTVVAVYGAAEWFYGGTGSSDE